MDHTLQIPAAFEEAFKGLDAAAAAAYFIVCHPEKEIEKISGLGVFSRDDDDYLTFDYLEGKY